MNREEILDVLESIKDGWGSFKVNIDRIDQVISMWEAAIGEYEFSHATAAVKRLVMKDRFAPSIADVRWEIRSGGWTIDKAIEACRPWAYYRMSQQFVNGSGFEPAIPSVHLPEGVAEVLRAARPEDEGWEERFRYAWRDATPK